MSECKEHAPGTFCWVELMTTDSEAAKAFYGKLMGWNHHDDSMGEDQVYTMLMKGDKFVGALYNRTAQQAEMGIPSHWASYVTVTDVDATIVRAKELGAKVLMEPGDVAEIGRMAVFQDPTGAALALWQPKQSAGAQIKGEPGAFCWNELLTNDTDTAATFYTSLFGWDPQSADMGGTMYTSFMAGDEPAGGMMAIQKEWGEVPPHWLVYFAVADCDQSTETAQGLGATVLVPPCDIAEVGRFSVVQDPQGAVCGLIRLTPKE